MYIELVRERERERERFATPPHTFEFSGSADGCSAKLPDNVGIVGKHCSSLVRAAYEGKAIQNFKRISEMSA